MRDVGGSHKSVIDGLGEKWSDSVCSLKAEPTGFADGWRTKCERTRVLADSEFLVWAVELLFTKIKNIPGSGEGLDSGIWILNLQHLADFKKEMSNTESDVCAQGSGETPDV